MLEQVAKVRDVPEHRHLRNAQRVLGLDHAANHHRAAIGHQNLRGRLLRNQGWVAQSVFVAIVGQCVFHIHVEEDGPFRCDLRSHCQSQESIHVGSGRRSAQ